MFRREPLALPFAHQLGPLARVLKADAPVQPPAPSAFVVAAIEHRVIGACLAGVAAGRLALPEEDVRTLRDAQAVAVLTTALARRELPGAAAAVKRATSAPAIVLKGPAISDRLYTDPALRPFIDLDLMVRRDALAEAARALAELGYEERIEYRPGFAGVHGHTVALERPVGTRFVHVELHWRVSDDRLGETLDYETLAAATEAVPGLPDAAYPGLPDQLLVCALHLMSHREKRLAWLNDIARLDAALDDAGWDQAFRRAERLGLLWVLNRALDYAERYLGLSRERPLAAAEPPAFGPIRAVEELDLQAAHNIGRLAALPWRRRPALVRDILVPSRAGLETLVGEDGAGPLRQLARHARLIIRGAALRR